MPLIIAFVLILNFSIDANAHEFSVRDSKTGEVVDVEITIIEVYKDK